MLEVGALLICIAVEVVKQTGDRGKPLVVVEPRESVRKVGDRPSCDLLESNLLDEGAEKS
jgi:hypothetical protein